MNIRRWISRSLAALVVLGVIFGSSPAIHALNVQSLRPSPGAVQGYHLFTSETMPRNHLAVGLGLNYDHHPWEVRIGGGGIQGVVDQFVTADFLLSYGALDWLTVNLDMPFNLYHNIAPVLVPTRDQGGGDAGDLSLGAKIRIFDANTTPLHLGLAIVPSLTLPTGRQSIFFGDSSVTGSVVAVGDLQWFSNRIYVNFGTRFRDNETISNVAIKDEFLYGAGFQRPLVKRWDLDGIGEIHGSTNFSDFFSRETSVPLELTAQVRKKWLNRRLIANLGVGVGLTQGYGTPLFRMLTGVAYAWPLKEERRAEEPLPPPVKLLKLKEQIHFQTGKAVILVKSYPVIDDVVTRLKKHPEIESLRIEGHTDSQGSEAYNLRLSQARADAVRNYLVDHGIQADRLQASGLGESEPIADDKTAAGRELNRRVVMRILED